MGEQQIVKYDNCINHLDFDDFKSKDLDLFMSFCLAIKDKSKKKVELSYIDILKMSNYHMIGSGKLHEYLCSRDFRKKIFGLSFGATLDNPKKYSGFVLFDKFEADEERGILTLEVSGKAEKFFNDLVGNFTLIDLAIYSSLRGKYTKLLYQHLCQYRNKDGYGYWSVSLDNFKILMSVPSSYQNKDITKEIIKPAVKELSSAMSVTVETLRGEGKGRPVEGYKFEFAEIKKIKESRKKLLESNGAHKEVVGQSEEIKQILEVAEGKINEASARTIHKTANKHKWSIQQVIDLIQKTNNLDGIESIGAYVVNCIQNGIHDPMPVKRKQTRNQFNDFPQRKRTKEEYKALEKALLKISYASVPDRDIDTKKASDNNG